MKIRNSKDNLKVIVGPALAVDTLIFTVREGKLNVLLIKVGSGPYQGKWALPGGIVQIDETLDEAAQNILDKKAGIKGLYMEQLYTFSGVNRDVRGRMVSVAYFALVDSDKIALKTMEDYYTDIKWHEVDHLPRLAFDHKEIIKYGFARLQAKIEYTNVAYGLLPEKFTLGELQSVYEIILERELDKRNFRKKIFALNIVQETKGMRRGGVSRPAQLYRFAQRSLMMAQIL